MREAGATAAQELAFTISNALEYVRCALDRGLELEEFAPRLSFFFAAHSNMFEEVAKFRAARRMWAQLMRERYGASDRSCRLRFHTQTAGSTLTAQQPLNNVVRVTVQALASVLGGTQSLHTNSYDEALALPGEEAARLALRTQQVLAVETGVADTVDPLGGSFYVESLTDQLESHARAYLDEIEAMGGPAVAIEYMREEIHQTAYRYQQAVERNATEIVGVNIHREEADSRPPPDTPDFVSMADEQTRRLAEVKAARDSSAVAGALDAIGETAEAGGNLLPAMIEAVKRRATLGEISQTLRDRWGDYKPAG
jgi:methylmalonyl-CoA mutase N-terminal domain/subunit